MLFGRFRFVAEVVDALAADKATIPTTKRLTSNAPTECWWIKPPGAMFKIGWNC